jgi:hypothetical protein
MKEERSVVLFHSTSAALRTEKLARKAGLSVKLIPVPRSLSSDCGVCISFNTADREALEGLLRENLIGFEQISSL